MASKSTHKPSHNTCLNYVPHAQADKAWHTKKTPIFAPTADARSSISPKLCMLIENVLTILKGFNHFSIQRIVFSYRSEIAAFWSLAQWVNLIPSGCHGNLTVTSIVWQFMGRFWCHFQRFLHNGMLCQVQYMVLIYVARWRHNLGPRMQMCTNIIFFTRRCIAQTTYNCQNSYR